MDVGKGKRSPESINTVCVLSNKSFISLFDDDEDIAEDDQSIYEHKYGKILKTIDDETREWTEVEKKHAKLQKRTKHLQAKINNAKQELLRDITFPLTRLIIPRLAITYEVTEL